MPFHNYIFAAQLLSFTKMFKFAEFLVSLSMKISRTVFGKVNGTDVYLFSITNRQGSTIKITNYGATITAILVPDLRKQLDDIAMGFDTIEGYLGNQPNIGYICGRYANRIAGASFTLEGKIY